jgi:plasmid stabilization system protein ParE
MRVIFSPEARHEFAEAERYYARIIPGLGEGFRDEIKAALLRIRAWPLACPVERRDIRRMVLSRFPYKVLYSVEADYIYLLAIAHQHRLPEYWTERPDKL